ncbi:hypothetical protein BBP40_002033, partial [Aspergillus hancockii]
MTRTNSPNFSWKEVSPGRWERDIDEAEQFYTSLAKTYEGSGRTFFAMTGHLSFSVPIEASVLVSETERRAEEALRKAWLRLRYDHPTLASWIEYKTDQKKCKKIYETAVDTASQEAWVDATFRVNSTKQTGQEWCNSDPPVPKLPTLFLIKPSTPSTGQVTGDLVLRCHHNIVDGIGTLLLFNNLVAHAAQAFDQGSQYPLPSFGDETVNLSPPLRVASGIRPTLEPQQKVRLDDIIQNNTALRTGVEIASMPFKKGPLTPGKHQRVAITLPAEQTSQLLHACKSLGLSVTHAYHTAISIGVRDLQKRESHDRTVRYINYSLINERPHCIEPYSSPAHAVAVYHSVSGRGLAIDLTVPGTATDGVPTCNESRQKEYLKISRVVRDFYLAIRDDPEHIYLVPSYWEMGTRPYPSDDVTPPVPKPNQTPSASISSMGNLDKVISRAHGAFQLDNPWVTGEELGTGLGLFLGTFKGQLTVSAAYNDAWHDRDEVIMFLWRCNQVTAQGLGVDLMSGPTTRNEWWFCGTLFIQALLVISLEVYILVEWLGWVNSNVTQVTISYIVPIGMGIVVFACVYEAMLSLDAIHHKNNISLVAICVTNTCIVVYSALQYTKMRGATHSLQYAHDIYNHPLADPSTDIWKWMRPAELAVPIILGLGSLTIIPAAYRLHKEYAWAIYKCIHGSADMRWRYLAYEIYLVLIRFDVFFLIGFIVQYNLVDVHYEEPEYSLTMAIIPAAILVMIFGIYCVKSELKLGMTFVIFCFFALIAYLLSRIVILCGKTNRANTPGKEMMLLFASVTLVLTVPLSLRGYLTPKDDNTTTLSLTLSGDFESHNCDALGGANANVTFDAKVLGRSVVNDDHQLSFKGTCPEHSPLEYPRSDPRTYATYRVSYALKHPYRMSTLATTIRLRLNDSDISCIATNITPYVGSVASGVLKGVPLVIMVLTGVITGALRTCRIRGRSIFRYELAEARPDPAASHFPGMRDCLQYIQFIFLTGCLSLSYPGFFRASTGELAWSSLILKNWPVTHHFTYPGVEDNIYEFNATYGLEEMSHFLGATVLSDLWTNAVVNLALIVLGAIVTLQLVWAIRWTWKLFPSRSSLRVIDLRTEFVSHMHHTGWSIARIILDYFLHPIVTFSLYQPLIAKWFPVYRTLLAVVFVSSLAASMAYIVRYLTKNNRETNFFDKGSFPRRSSHDWLSDTLYGLPFLRGLAIGALQTSGLGQVLVLMACELFILACLLWNRQTKRIWRHACLSGVRLVVLAMSCAFLPRAGLEEGRKALVAYFIISLHTTVLFAGFIVDCLYDLFKFLLYKLGLFNPGPGDLGPQSHEAPVFGISQLSRRSTRRMSFARLPALNPA